MVRKHGPPQLDFLSILIDGRTKSLHEEALTSQLQDMTEDVNDLLERKVPHSLHCLKLLDAR
jgi:hypothetical protein